MMNQSDSDIQNLLKFLGRKLIVLVGFAVVGVFVGIILSITMAKVYRAEAVVALASADAQEMQGSGILGQFEGIAGIAGVSLGRSDPLYAIAVLESKAFTERFIERHHLLPLMFPDKWDDKDEDWAVEETARPSIRDARRLMERTIRRVEQDTASGLVWLIIDWRDRELAAAWANLMISDLNEDLRDRALIDSQKSISYLKQQLESTNIIEIRQAIYRLMERQMHQVMLANIREEYALKVIDPAVVPEAKDHIRPQPFVLAVIGFLLGLLIGMVIVLSSRRLGSG